MKRPVLTREQNHKRIAGEGAKAAQKKFDESRKQILTAMAVIEADVEKNAGVYPFAGGKITMAEVLRRAGKSEGYLRKSEPASLLELKEEVQDFVDRASRLISQGARNIRKDVTDRVREAQAELDLVRQAYHETELQFSDTLNLLQNAERTIEELRAEKNALLKKLADKTVVDLDTRRK